VKLQLDLPMPEIEAFCRKWKIAELAPLLLEYRE